MKYVYPAVFTEEDGKILVSVPDLPGTHTFGDNMAEAIIMAQDAAAMWLWDAENKGEEIPGASPQSAFVGDAVSLLLADTDEYRRQYDNKSIKKTLSIPAWLNYKAETANAPFSQILQEGLKNYLKAH
jgi:predicted RNase H-like HicB family nuclease